MSEPRGFHARDHFEITGRGTCYVVDLPNDLWNALEAPRLVGAHVFIDGEAFVVRGVEMPAVPWRPGSRAFKTVSLLVGRVSEATR